MATAAVQQAPGNEAFGRVAEPLVQQNKVKKHDVESKMYYYKDPGDGTAPPPTYVVRSVNVYRKRTTADIEL